SVLSRRETLSIYTLSLHDALPISDTRCFEIMKDLGYPTILRDFLVRHRVIVQRAHDRVRHLLAHPHRHAGKLRKGTDVVVVQLQDRKSTRLNSSHVTISYAVFCLK